MSQRVGLDILERRSGVPRQSIENLFKAMIGIMEEGRAVNIPGFGTFTPTIQEKRPIKSPILEGGEAVVPRQRRVKFSLSKHLREAWKLE